MSDKIFEELDIPDPKYNLDINGGLHGEQTGRMLIEIEETVIREKPAIIIVFGDTNSTLAGSLVSAKLHIPCIHIEAGLRSFNRTMPEEINRIVTDHISDLLFAPTQAAMDNLKSEGLDQKSYLTGDIMVDSHKYAITKSAYNDVLTKYSLTENNYYLLTLHRPYNVDNPENLSKIFHELGNLSDTVLFPVHPRTEIVIEKNSLVLPPNLKLVKPVGYLDFVQLQVKSRKIITDSGGIQKEAYILKKPCITLRSETEWVETVDYGWNLLINPVSQSNYYNMIEAFNPQSEPPPVFGECVADKIKKIINNKFR